MPGPGSHPGDGALLGAPLWRLRALAPDGRSAQALWLLHVALTGTLAATLNVWTDEGFSLHTTSGTAAETLRQALRFEQQPPVYFLALWLWRQIAAGPVWARLLSVLCAALAARLAVPLARRYAPAMSPGWALGLVALNPFVIYAAVEIRLYALALLLSALLLLLFHDGYLVEEPRRWARALHGLCAAAALGTQYFLGSLLVAGAVALVALGRRAALRAYAGVMALLALGLVPLALQVPRQVRVHTGEVRGRVTLPEGGLLVYRRVARLLWPVEGLGASGRAWIPWALLGGLLLLLARRLRRRAPCLPAPEAALLCGAAAATLCFVPVAVLMGGEPMQHRHLAPLLLPLLLVILALLPAASPRERAGWLVLTAVLYATSLLHRYGAGCKGGDWARVGAYLAAAAAPGEPILVFHGGAALPLGFHYSGPNPLVALPQENRFDTYDVQRYVVRGPEALARRVAEGAGDAPRLWLVTDGECGWMGLVDYRCDLLEAYFAAGYRVERDLSFQATRVRRLRRLRPAGDGRAATATGQPRGAP